MLGKDGVEKAFSREFAESYHIHRTRQNFPNDGIDDFRNMAATGVTVIDRVVKDLSAGTIDREDNTWIIPVGDQ